jgi:hypothetical protein
MQTVQRRGFRHLVEYVLTSPSDEVLNLKFRRHLAAPGSYCTAIELRM